MFKGWELEGRWRKSKAGRCVADLSKGLTLAASAKKITQVFGVEARKNTRSYLSVVTIRKPDRDKSLTVLFDP